MYQIVGVNELLDLLIEINPNGVQVSKRIGNLNSTKCIYLNDGLVYIFDLSDKFEFKLEDGMRGFDFCNLYQNQKWIIEQIIS